MRITEDDFEIWWAGPVSEEFKRWARMQVAHLQRQWLEISLHGGDCDPVVLADIRGRIAMVRECLALTAEDLNDPDQSKKEEE